MALEWNDRMRDRESARGCLGFSKEIMQGDTREIQSVIDGRIEQAGLAQFVDHDRQRVTEAQGGFFLELIIRDAARKKEFESVLRKAQEQLRANKIELEVFIRALWVVKSCEYQGPSYAENGGLRSAVAFVVLVYSGGQECAVVVNVTIAAIDVVRRKLGLESLYGYFGWSPKKGDISQECLSQVIKGYAKSELDSELAGYWDPLVERTRDLNEAGMRLLLGESTAFRDLRTAIHGAFVGPGSKRFVEYLLTQRIDFRSFDQVLPELGNIFGGGFSRGDQFLVSSSDLYNRLRRVEQDLLRCYFGEVVELHPKI